MPKTIQVNATEENIGINALNRSIPAKSDAIDGAWMLRTLAPIGVAVLMFGGTLVAMSYIQRQGDSVAKASAQTNAVQNVSVPLRK